jgi:nucleotide-binding universal stress UspA family protein
VSRGLGPLLLATEHTEFDVGAERIAFDLARRHGLPLRVVLPLASNPEFEGIAPREFLRHEERAAHNAAALREAAGGVEVTVEVREGPEPWREIVGAARDFGAGLLIARRRGRRGFLANALVGDIVSKVAGHAPCSVLLVPRSAQAWHRRVLAAVDGSPSSDAVARVAAAVSKACAIPLTLLSAHDRTAEFRDRAGQALMLAQAAAGGAISCEIALVEGDAHRAILNAAAHSGADLIVMGRQGRTRLDRPVLGAVAQKVVGLAPGPVLLVQA